MSAAVVPQEVRDGIADALAERPDRDLWRVSPTYFSSRGGFTFTVRRDGMLMPSRDALLREGADLREMRKATRVFVLALLADYDAGLEGGST